MTEWIGGGQSTREVTAHFHNLGTLSFVLFLTLTLPFFQFNTPFGSQHKKIKTMGENHYEKLSICGCGYLYIFSAVSLSCTVQEDLRWLKLWFYLARSKPEMREGCLKTENFHVILFFGATNKLLNLRNIVSAIHHWKFETGTTFSLFCLQYHVSGRRWNDIHLLFMKCLTALSGLWDKSARFQAFAVTWYEYPQL